MFSISLLLCRRSIIFSRPSGFLMRNSIREESPALKVLITSTFPSFSSTSRRDGSNLRGSFFAISAFCQKLAGSQEKSSSVDNRITKNLISK